MCNSPEHAVNCESAQTLIDFPINVAPQLSSTQAQETIAHVAGCNPCMTYAMRDGHGTAFQKLLVISDVHHQDT